MTTPHASAAGLQRWTNLWGNCRLRLVGDPRVATVPPQRAVLVPTADGDPAGIAQAEIYHAPRIDRHLLQSISPDVCLLHNTSPGRLSVPLNMPHVLYRHSTGTVASSMREVCCSQWLARQTGVDDVLYQGVPIPPRPVSGATRRLRERLLIGRLCTPTLRKWPQELFDFYRELSARFPEADWEFVGCPPEMQPRLATSVNTRTRFLPAGWPARSHLWRWDILLYHHPSLAESFGRTVAEAMRAGCIPVVDDRGGFREQVSPETGVLCTTPADFQAALQRLTDRTTRLRYSSSAQRAAEDQFSLAAFSRRLWRLFEQLVDRQ